MEVCQDHDGVIAPKFCTCAGVLRHFCEPCFTRHCNAWHTLVMSEDDSSECTNCSECGGGPAIVFCICKNDFPSVCSKCQKAHCLKMPAIHWMFPFGIKNRMDSVEAKEFARNKVYYYLSGLGKIKFNLDKIAQCKKEVMRSLATLGTSKQVKDAESNELQLLTETENRLNSEIECAEREVATHLLEKTFTSPSGVSEALFKFNTLEDLESLDFFKFTCTQAGLDCDPMSGVVWDCRLLPDRKICPMWTFKEIVLMHSANMIYYSPVTGSRKVELSRAIRDPSFASWTFLPNGDLFVVGFHPPSDEAIMIKPNGQVICVYNLPYAKHSPGICYFEGFVYSFGGMGKVSLQSSENYSLASQRWTELPPMLTARHYFNACLYKRQVYLCGGFTASCEIYSIDTTSFSALPFTLPEGNTDATTILNNKQLYIFTTNKLTVVDIATNQVRSRGKQAGRLAIRCQPVVLGDTAYVIMTPKWGGPDGVMKIDLITAVFSNIPLS